MITRDGRDDNNAPVVDLPDAFRTLKVQDYLVLLHTLGLAATTAAKDDARVSPYVASYRNGTRVEPVQISVLDRRIEAACAIINDWPNALYNLLDGIVYRNEASTEALPERRAFATEIGRMFLHPLRGANGLPLPILHEVVTTYCATRLGLRRRARKPSACVPVVRRIQRYVEVSTIAVRLNISSRSKSLTRSYRQIILKLTDAELQQRDENLARTVADRTVALYDKVATAVSLRQARKLLEGVYIRHNSFTSWHHPRLLTPDPELFGLQRPGVALYPRESIQRILDRIDDVAVRIANTAGLEPMYDAINAGALGNGYSRTQFLIDVLDGLLPVYAVVDRPRFGALFADPGEIRRLAAERRVYPLDGSETYRAPNTINYIVVQRLGNTVSLTYSELVRLAKSGIIRFKSNPRPGKRHIYLFCTQDVLAYLFRAGARSDV